ncbi:MAG: trypsin-like peptidase domain-containing protein [Actinomycetota bacterium]
MSTDTEHPTEALITRLAEDVAPSVVRIGRDHRGSGVIAGQDTIVTNSHHLRDRTTTVSFADGTTVDAEVRAADADGDLVVLDAATSERPHITWGDGDALALGRELFAVGTDPGIGPRVTVGRVSAVNREFSGPRGRRIAGAVEHTAPVRRGGSGGPVVDADGAVVGISTHRVRGGLYLARPVDERFRERVARLVEGDDVERPRLGVALAAPAVARRLRRSVGLPERDGLLVRDVEDDSPAAAAGLAEGDLIVGAGGSAISDVDGLFAALEDAGDRVVLDVVRGAEDVELTVELGG